MRPLEPLRSGSGICRPCDVLSCHRVDAEHAGGHHRILLSLAGHADVGAVRESGKPTFGPRKRLVKAPGFGQELHDLNVVIGVD